MTNESGHQLTDFIKDLTESVYYRTAEKAKFAAMPAGAQTWLTARSTGLGNWFARSTRLEFDSDLFGLEEARIEPLLVPAYFGQLTDDVLEQAREFTTAIVNDAVDHNVDHLTAPAKSANSFAAIVLQHGGFIMSDTILVFGMDLAMHAGDARCDAIRPARQDDIDVLEDISAACFTTRRFNANRFNSDKSFQPRAVESLYRQWVTKCVQGMLADEVIVYTVADKPVGYIALSITRLAEGEALGTIPLNAVAPEHHGQGVYTALARAAVERLRELGAGSVEIRTQLSNFAVHRTWQRLGAIIVDAYHTFHYPLIR